ncbi:hypothetical protein [Leucobacter chromiireducens]|uniref:hypothetical protein n=1 Tax=Leucobacter chromiireducens TaxID=283877 RepID=UPI000F63AC2F|nr:hypothetical protein [Leucobacter chromiireducens]
MSAAASGVGRARVQRVARGGAFAAVILTICLGASGCAGSGSDAPGSAHGAASGSAEVIATVPVSELSGVDGALEPGEEIRVLIDTPGVDWEVVSAAEEVARVVEDDPEANPRIVRVVAEQAGSALISFTPQAGSDADAPSDPEQLAVTVGAEPAA